MQDKKPMSPQNQERDDFWDADKLIPPTTQQKRTVSQPSKRSTTTVEMELPPVKTSTQTPNVHTSQPLPITGREPRVDHGGGAYPTTHENSSEEPTLSYEAEGCLLHTVKVYTWRTGYHYFDQFITDAQNYASLKGQPTPKQPFFSYFPQYAQMSRKQKAWYLWWRDNTKQGVYMETDYAYILLFLFELINLPANESQAMEARDTMAKIWMVYRKAYPQLDHYMCEWLCDYCLIHALAAPVEILLPALSDVISTARLKEFYLSAMITVGDEGVNLASARILLSFCCQYDYRKSKFATGEHKELFDTLIPGAIAATFPLVIGSKGGGGVVMDDSYISRDAYVGALCAYGNKRRIEIAYTSFSRSHDLRFLIGDMVRHVENRLRGCLGVRSKLTTHFLDTPLKKALDAWLEPRLPKTLTPTQAAAKNTPRPAYEALYDLPHTQVSIAEADAIEQSSWDTTRILIEAFEEPSEPSEPLAEPMPESLVTPTPESAPSIPCQTLDTATETQAASLLSQLGDRVVFLKAALSHDVAGQRAYCQSTKQMPDALADEINDIALTCEFYDIILEDVGGMYAVVEDYQERLDRMLNV